MVHVGRYMQEGKCRKVHVVKVHVGKLHVDNVHVVKVM